jgi:hypothetical protein
VAVNEIAYALPGNDPVMKKCLALIALLLSACEGTTTSLPETVAVASHTAGPRPGAQAAAPALLCGYYA